MWSPSANPRIRVSVSSTIPGETLTISNNIFKDATTEKMLFAGGQSFYDLPSLQASEYGVGTTTGDPLFVNASAADFHLQPASPAIDSGVNVGLIRDFEGTPVPSGVAPDIGAFESTGPGVALVARGYVGQSLGFPIGQAGAPEDFTAVCLPAWASLVRHPDTGILTLTGTPPACGRHLVLLQPVDPLDFRPAIVIVEVLATYDDWRTSNFGADERADESVSGALADAAGDGVANLVKFALGSHAAAADPARLPRVEARRYGVSEYLTLGYTRDRFAASAPRVEVSDDLVNWRSGHGHTQEMSRTVNPDGTETVLTRDLYSTAEKPARFMRMTVAR